jgi:predicted DNA-binding transcriptional regulator AlpA
MTLIRPRFLTRKAVAGRLMVSESTVDRLVDAGRIPQPIRLGSRGGLPRWDVEAIDKALAGSSGSAQSLDLITFERAPLCPGKKSKSGAGSRMAQ